MKANISWNSKLTFTGNVRGHETILDTSLSNGGLNRGPSPKEMLLNSIGACAGMDIVSIIKQHKENLLTLDIKVEADMTNTTPAYFKKVNIQFKITGDVNEDKAKKAVRDSMTKYCGVSLMLSKSCPILYETFLNGIHIDNGESKFA